MRSKLYGSVGQENRPVNKTERKCHSLFVSTDTDMD